MILRKQHRILVQGITGKQGSFWTAKMMEYGATVVGGVNPKKAGTEHLGVPVFADASSAAREAEFDVALMFVPPLAAKPACIDACEAGAQLLVCLTEHIPVHDVMEMVAVAASHGARLVGPNTAGLVTPGETFAGIMPAFNDRIFQPGTIGVISRSGSLGALVCLNLTRHGFGQSTFYGVGGDPIIGTTPSEALALLAEDERTEAIVVCGEIGGTAEEELAELAAKIAKPVVAFVAGQASPADRKMGHAGAIVAGDKGSYPSKRKALERAGVQVADIPSQVPELLAQTSRGSSQS